MTTGPQDPAVGGDDPGGGGSGSGGLGPGDAGPGIRAPVGNGPGSSAPGMPARRTGHEDAPHTWRVQHSLWLLLPVFNLAWIGFVVTGRLAHKREWLAWAVAYGIVPAGLLVAAVGSHSPALFVATLIASTAAWVGGIVHGTVINAEYLNRTWAAQTGRLVTGRDPAEHLAVTSAPNTTAAPTSATADRQARTLALARGPRFPRASAATVAAIDEVLQPVLAEGLGQRLTEPQRQRVEQIVGEYLPQSVEGFLRFPDTFLAEAGRREHFTTLLDQQLGALLDAARTLQTSVFADEADGFEANGRYLRDRFGRSSLDLDQP